MKIEAIKLFDSSVALANFITAVEVGAFKYVISTRKKEKYTAFLVSAFSDWKATTKMQRCIAERS